MATLTSPSHLFVVITIIIASTYIEVSAALGGRKQIVGGWEPIKDPKDQFILEIGEFAILEHNSETGSKLEFDTVIKGDQQVVEGMNYRLSITARDMTDGGLQHWYEAVVYDKSFGADKIRKLISFTKVGY